MKTVLISGGSRGIGQAIGLRFAESGANIAILSKDTQSNIEQSTELLAKTGAEFLILDVDVSKDSAIKEAVAKVVKRFDGIDVLVNNTSAACLNDTLHLSSAEFDHIIGTSVRAAFFLSQSCLPALQKSPSPHIINISPPLNLEPYWFKDYLGFSIGKYAMSLCTLGLSAEFNNVCVNSLWPQTTIATQTIKDLFVEKVYSGSRWPKIMADAAFALAQMQVTGQFFTDEALLRQTGVADFSHYAVDPNVPLMQPLFIPLEKGMTPIANDLFLNRVNQL